MVSSGTRTGSGEPAQCKRPLPLSLRRNMVKSLSARLVGHGTDAAAAAAAPPRKGKGNRENVAIARDSDGEDDEGVSEGGDMTMRLLSLSTTSASSGSKRAACSEADGDNDGVESVVSQGATKSFNAQGVVSGDVVVHRAPVIRFLRVPSSATAKPFKPPLPKGWRMPAAEVGLGANRIGLSESGMPRKKRLGMRGRMNGIVSGGPRFVPLLPGQAGADRGDYTENDEDVVDELFERYKLDPVVLYEGEGGHTVTVEPVIGKYLREHQREGMQFLFECVANMREYEGCGCILADDMGLGKTLQSVTLIYTVLRQGLEPGKPLAKRVLVVTPTSLVRNWDNEFDKWLKGRVRCLAIAESSRKEIEKQIRCFTTTRMYDVCIISYDTFRLNKALFSREDAADLLICDEAHRLKNDQTQTSQALDTLHTKRRVLLSGTPMQNDLEEFFSMVNFSNPNVLGSVSQFRKKFQTPILIGREPDASETEVAKSEERSNELSDIVNHFILRRTNSLLSKHLPPKLTMVVCVKLSEMQTRMYKHMIYAKLLANEEEKTMALNAKRTRDQALADGTAPVTKPAPLPTRCLASINELKKLCNHPQLLFQQKSKYSSTGRGGGSSKKAYGMETINDFFPENFDGGGKSGLSARSSSRGANSDRYVSHSLSNYEWSGKFLVCQRLLTAMRRYTDDRMVIVSNYTQTLDLFDLMCREFNFPFVRLDGSASSKRRQAMVDRLNNPNDDVFIFLLSSKAGGCGLNLIGANRLILFDPDWNPATDKQAAARVWRDGQKKRTYVYRFLSTGTIEEKVFQRQLSKEGLQSVVEEDQSMESAIAISDLKDLFTLCENTVSDTHDKYKCRKCTFINNGKNLPPVEEMRLDEPPGSPRKDGAAGGSPPASPVSKFMRGGGRFKGPRGAGGSIKRSKPTFTNVPATIPPDAEQVDLPNEGALCEWSHHYGCDSVDDVLLRMAGRGLVSFVFGQAIDGDSLAKKAEVDATKATKSTTKIELKSVAEADESKPAASCNNDSDKNQHYDSNSAAVPALASTSVEKRENTPLCVELTGGGPSIEEESCREDENDFAEPKSSRSTKSKQVARMRLTDIKNVVEQQQ